MNYLYLHYMTDNLEKYKTSKLNELTITYNSNLLALRNILVVNIQKINNSKVSKFIKLQQITILQNSYNISVAKLTNEFKQNKNNILSTTSLPATKNALLIGINYIGTPNELYGCINDTTNIKNLLQQTFSFHNFNLLTEQTNKKPTKQNILDSITNLLVSANKGDSLFILYSGHGTHTIDLSGDELDGQDEMIVPLDYSTNSCIVDDQLNQIITTHLKEGVKLFMLFDSCFSGTIVDLKYSYGDSETINPTSLETKGQVIMISGCTDNQTSADAVVSLNNTIINSGAMTFTFLKTIQDMGTTISLKMLINNMRNILKQNGYTQIPQLSSGTNIDINQLTISTIL